MDSFFEQIVTIKTSGKKTAGLVLLWIFALVLCVLLYFLCAIIKMFYAVLILGICGILYGAYKLSLNFFKEYEYIVTNDELDIDEIIAKNSRKRLITIDIPNIALYGEYKEELTKPIDKRYICCNKDDYKKFIYYHHKTQGNVFIVFSPNEKIETALKKYLPKY